MKHALSNLPAGTSRLLAVRLWRSRWPVEQGYQQMKEELGLVHHEGRSRRCFNHHACLVLLAFGSLTLEECRARRIGPDPAKGGDDRRKSLCRRCAGRWCGYRPRSVGTTARTAVSGSLNAS
jgi:hypothetical protein